MVWCVVLRCVVLGLWLYWIGLDWTGLGWVELRCVALRCVDPIGPTVAGGPSFEVLFQLLETKNNNETC